MVAFSFLQEYVVLVSQIPRPAEILFTTTTKIQYGFLNWKELEKSDLFWFVI